MPVHVPGWDNRGEVMIFKTPGDVITNCTETIGQFLHEGMQQHAIDELEFAISWINAFHHKRNIQNEISDIDDALACVRPMESRCNDEDSIYSTIVKLLESKRDRLVDELELMK